RPQRRIVGLHRLHIVRSQHLVPGRHRPGRGALEYGELCGLLGDDRDRLDRRRARTDHADTKAGEVDALMRPLAGVLDGALEILDAGEFRPVWRRQATYRHDAELGADLVVAIGFDVPAFRALVPDGRCHTGVEHDVATQPEAVGNVVGV